MKNLGKYRWLTIAVCCMLLAFGVTGCTGLQSAKPVEIAASADSAVQVETDTSADPAAKTEAVIAQAQDTLQLKYTLKGVTLEHDGEIVFGPCKFIYEEYEKDGLFRFIDEESGLIGYARNDHGTVSVFIPGSYTQAYPFSEAQGEFARVQKPDGSWCIIDENAAIIFDGFDFINELPMIENLATGVKDGQAVLLDLDTLTFQTEPSIKKAYPEYRDISDIYFDFAVVTGMDGKQGVINVLHDEIIVTVQYEEVTWQTICAEGADDRDQVMFLCRKADGSYDVVSHICYAQ